MKTMERNDDVDIADFEEMEAEMRTLEQNDEADLVDYEDMEADMRAFARNHEADVAETIAGMWRDAEDERAYSAAFERRWSTVIDAVLGKQSGDAETVTDDYEQDACEPVEHGRSGELRTTDGVDAVGRSPAQQLDDWMSAQWGAEAARWDWEVSNRGEMLDDFRRSFISKLERSWALCTDDAERVALRGVVVEWREFLDSLWEHIGEICLP